MHLGDRGREEREREAEVAVQQLLPVVEVLLPQALVLVQPEQHLQRLRSRRGLSWPWCLAISELTGSPGIIRGMKKLMVIAAQSGERGRRRSVAARNFIGPPPSASGRRGASRRPSAASRCLGDGRPRRTASRPPSARRASPIASRGGSVGPAARHGVRAARVEPAAGRRRDQARRLAVAAVQAVASAAPRPVGVGRGARAAAGCRGAPGPA